MSDLMNEKSNDVKFSSLSSLHDKNSNDLLKFTAKKLSEAILDYVQKEDLSDFNPSSNNIEDLSSFLIQSLLDMGFTTNQIRVDY